MGPLHHHFWGLIISGSAERRACPYARLGALRTEKFGASEVGDNKVTCHFYKDVLGLQIAMNNSSFME